MSWIQTFSGKAFRFDQSMVDNINIVDIAHHLSMKCRFNGACTQFYSVAEHSVRMSYEAEGLELQRWSLLHDAGEAYLPDVPRPLKKLGVLIGGELFDAIEGRILKIIADKHNLRFDRPPSGIHELDMRMLATEKRDLMAEEPEPWAPMPEPFEFRIISWPWYHAKRHFMNRHRELFG